MATTGIPSLAHVQVNSSELGGTLDPPATVPAPAVNHVAARARRHSNVQPPTPDLTADAGTGAASRLVARGYGGRVGALDRTRSQLAGLLDLLRLRRVCRRLGMCWDQFLDRNQISMPLTSKMYKYIQTCTEKGK